MKNLQICESCGVGSRVALLLNMQGQTQRSVAKSLGMTESVFSAKKNETGRTFNRDEIVALADFFHVSSDYLLGRIDTFWPSPDMCRDPEGQGMLQMEGV